MRSMGVVAITPEEHCTTRRKHYLATSPREAFPGGDVHGGAGDQVMAVGEADAFRVERAVAS